MLRRCWALAVVGIFSIAIVPAWGQTGSLSYNKEKVQALNKMVNDLLIYNQGNPNMGFNGNFNVQGSPQLFFLANENKAENLAGATSRVFLGVKIECAQCHAHPFAKWSKEQFWEFAAFYS